MMDTAADVATSLAFVPPLHVLAVIPNDYSASCSSHFAPPSFRDYTRID
jgi:hypothetical protein